MKFNITYLTVFLAIMLHINPVMAKSSDIGLMWQVPFDVSDQELDQMKKAGITVIQHFNTGKWNEEQLTDYMNRAAAHDLRVILYVGFFMEHKGFEWRLTKTGKEFISKWKSHLALFAWHTFDEPAAADHRAYKQAQENIYHEIKSLDPKTPIFESLNLTNSKQWNRYFSEKAFDILDIHAYVNKKIGWRQKRLLTNFHMQRRGSYPVIITLRSFNGWAGRTDLDPDGLMQQYVFFFEENHVTQHIGYYGWKLGLYKGISQDANLTTQFINVAATHKLNKRLPSVVQFQSGRKVPQ